MIKKSFLLIPVLVLLAVVPAYADNSPVGDPFAPVFEAFGVILVAALMGRFIARKLNLSLVLGEVAMGILLGVILATLHRPGIVVIRHQNTIVSIIDKVDEENLGLNEAVTKTLEQSSLSADEKEVLASTFDAGNAERYIIMARTLLLFSSLGIAMLMFTVGLQSNISDIIRLGPRAVLVASFGILASALLGYVIIKWLFPAADSRLALFVGGALSSSSTGLTARILKEMNKLESPESKIIMGVAVFDDILGLMLLAVITGIVATGSIAAGAIGLIITKATLFLTAVALIGLFVLPRIARFIEKLDPHNIRLLFPMALLLLMCTLADSIGLAMTVGAFAAGLILTETLFTGKTSEEQTIQKQIAPVEGIFVPVFFVLLGAQVDITLFADWSVIGTALLITVAAVLGKIGMSVLIPKGINKLPIGIGMIPRGEIALIFMSLGKSVGAVSETFYAVIVMVILLTIVITPPALKWAFNR